MSQKSAEQLGDQNMDLGPKVTVHIEKREGARGPRVDKDVRAHGSVLSEDGIEETTYSARMELLGDHVATSQAVITKNNIYTGKSQTEIKTNPEEVRRIIEKIARAEAEKDKAVTLPPTDLETVAAQIAREKLNRGR